MSFVNTEDMHRAARRMEDAAKEATQAADRLEEAVRQMRLLTDSGYGNNVETLIELLRNANTKTPPAIPFPLPQRSNPTRTELRDMKIGGWHLCPYGHGHVKNGEQCPKCEEARK